MSETPCGLGDDAGADRVGAVGLADRRGGAEHREFAGRLLAVGDERRDQRARRAQLAQQQRDARLLVEREIVDAGRRRGEEFGDGALVHVGILAQIERREMEAEHVDGAAQRAQAAAREDGARRWPRANGRWCRDRRASSAALA